MPLEFLQQLADDMLSVRRAAAVAADENLPAVAVAGQQKVKRLRDFVPAATELRITGLEFFKDGHKDRK